MNRRFVPLVLLAFSLICLAGSVMIAVQNRSLTSPGLMPAIASAVMVLCMVFEVFLPAKDRDRKEPLPVKELLITLGFILFLCLSLRLGLNFYIAAAIFLLGLLSCLSGGKYLRNLIMTAAALVIIFLVFTLGLDITFN